MQGVAAKDDASYDLSRARASVAGQTTMLLYCDDVPAERRIVTALFAGALFLSAFLLFVLERWWPRASCARSAAHRLNTLAARAFLYGPFAA